MTELEERKVTQLDATNKAWRTLLQGLAFDLVAVLSLVLYTAVLKAETWGDLEWALIGFTMFKSIMVSGLSYLMRTVLGKQMPPANLG